MAVIARYIWGKTEKGSGWNLWEGCGLSIEKDGKTGYWGIYEQDGSLLCQCVTYRDAQKVIVRLRIIELVQLNPNSYQDLATLTETNEGVTYHGYQIMPSLFKDYGKTFPILKDAEALIRSQELTHKA